MENQQQFDDRGYLFRNEDRKNESHPSHKGKITLSRTTLKALMDMFKAEGTAVVYLSAWSGKKQGEVKLAAQAPQAYRSDSEQQQPQRRPVQQAQRQQVPARKMQAQQEADDFDDEILF